MRLPTALLGALLAGRAPQNNDGRPPPQPVRIDPIPDIQITNFRAGAVILSHRFYVNFNITFPPNTPFESTPLTTYCHTIGTSLTETIGEVHPLWCNRNTDSPPTPQDVFWSLDFNVEQETFPNKTVKTPLNAELLLYRVISNETRMEGRALLSREDMPMVGESYPRQIYQGPGNFSVKGRRVSGGRGFIPGDGDGDDA
ncbi:uncharacterized protein PODANS_1_8460 [Podospora anserina S mat+]|uniref:Podospora anserina S mat+ genomic DNA chromosome 1, supercontig 1 n=1 Tax=Podospora anserina (strain S / ATCC MYA-4624 / DSM 980 / FGSC 10383) TaxID=515849 RepID=B2A954_PODAN|nr:uncharacterized protein PODANS_1_8460 [Podospora anserina S mat+]CAP60555.1 unnamed protein product [Podospora anserina S mat+]CDP23198.1 Putative protein of unknown function [Podospora anserina S mat+]